MGRMVSFRKNGVEVSGYLSEPEFGKGPMVLVFHEWWGLVDHIKDVCDRYAKEGFYAFGIDLYGGKTASDPENAGKLMQDLFQNRFAEAKEIVRACIEYFKEQDMGYVPRTGEFMLGATGFCCGGTCTWYFGAEFAQDFKALVPYYGLYSIVPIDFSKIKAPVLAIHAGKDAFIPLSDVLKAIEECNNHGVPAQFLIYSGVDHAFFNDSRPEVYHEEYASDVWEKTIAFFNKHLK
ncbi:dienelactone hydrolase family protein [Hydrogenobacter sp. T-2]|uniref:dienelactone hydrolase family protein n=1 Tax=Pampinifervens diazotrophicum TaxID=1632018 RepID=UPI002B257385|nr:dienelactone hydrolase family protein [Hydrogenobacter sp. T-2]WPM32479.1 dienelactone hydrolase family protein [Hydrogenobacter sp. T-2]